MEKYLPPANQAATVTALAVVATAGAAATPLLIRIIRPVVKKLWTTVQKKVGKNVSTPSRLEIATNNYREKKGLPPIKKEVKKKCKKWKVPENIKVRNVKCGKIT